MSDDDKREVNLDSWERLNNLKRRCPRCTLSIKVGPDGDLVEHANAQCKPCL